VRTINQCPQSKTCEPFDVKKYENANYQVTLNKYENCLVKVTNSIPWDKHSQSEPVFGLSTTTPDGLFYYSPIGQAVHYNKDWNFGQFKNFTNGIAVNHTYNAWVQIINLGATKAFKIGATMKQYRQCLKSVNVLYKSCVQCLAMSKNEFSWEQKSSLCYSTQEPLKGH
jgi:hypothetical protein